MSVDLFDALPRSPSTRSDAVVKATQEKKVKKKLKREQVLFPLTTPIRPWCISNVYPSRSLACSESSLTFNIHQTTKSYGENVPIGKTGRGGRKFGSNSYHCCIISDLCLASQRRRPTTIMTTVTRVIRFILLFRLSFGGLGWVYVSRILCNGRKDPSVWATLIHSPITTQ